MRRQNPKEPQLSLPPSPRALGIESAWSATLSVPRDVGAEAVSDQDNHRPVRDRYSDSYLVQMYSNQALGTPLLTVEEERQLGALNRQNNEYARERLILSNLRLVVSIAKTFSNYGLELPDLIGFGNLGLMKAVDRFDPTRGAKFSTYASWWIKQAIRRGLTNDAATVRVPANAQQKARDLIKVERELTEELDREPTMQELSKRTGLTAEQIQHIRESRASRLTVSLDTPLSGSDSAHNSALLSDTFADPNITPTSEVMIQDERHHVVRAIVGDRDSIESLPESWRPLIEFHRSKFTAQEFDILKNRFGLGSAGGITQTLEELGSKYALTRERIRQLEARALKKFKVALEHIDRERDPALEEIVTAAKRKAIAQAAGQSAV
jgi:RNA polymerase primary sigma factor